MKCVILAGGKGTRISELSKNVPKPMIPILSKPIIFRIMQHYSKYGFKDFIIAAGYKKQIINNYFAKIKIKNWEITFFSKFIKERKIVPKKTNAFGLRPAAMNPSLNIAKLLFEFL